MIEAYQNAVPAEIAASAQTEDQRSSEDVQAQLRAQGLDDESLSSFVVSWRTRLNTDRQKKKNIWNECWQLYRGLEDWRDKEDWQSKVTLPKSFNSVKQATNAIMRLLETADMPWSLDPVNPDDSVTAIRGEKIAKILKILLEEGGLYRAFAEGLESGFITGVGVWKVWWGFESRQRFGVQTAQQPDGQAVRQIVREEISEGKLFVRAVDPYNFYWLPGSRFNKWVGTIEEIDVPKYELLRLAGMGAFGKDGVKKVKNLGEGKRASDRDEQSDLRFAEPINFQRSGNPGRGTGLVRLTEFYGPILDKDGNLVEPNGHLIIANDDKVLVSGTNPFWHRSAPYVAFSPLLLPFRTDGVGIVEQVRGIDRAMNKLLNMGLDKELFKLLPMFEVFSDAYENPEDLEVGVTPGKFLRRSRDGQTLEGIKPIVVEGVQQDMVSLAGILDRGHQEGSFISEIQQALPRFRGEQTLGEIKIKGGQQQDFLSAMAKDIDEFALKPILELSMDTMLQFLDTKNDPRIGSVLGIGAEYLRGMQLPELLEIIAGDYIVKVSGVTDQIDRAEQLQNLIQFLNVLSQQPETLMPHLRTDEFLQRILEAFRGAVRDPENLIEDPMTVEAKRAALQNSAVTPELLRMMPQFVKMAAEIQRDGGAEGLTQAAQQAQPQVAQQLQQEKEQQAASEAKRRTLEEAAFQAELGKLRSLAEGFENKNYVEQKRT